MISNRTLTGATILEYRFTELLQQLELLSLYEAKTLKGQSGTGSYDELAIVEDDYEIIKPFFEEFHTMLFPVLSTILLQTNPDIYTLTPGNISGTVIPLPNIEWHIADEPVWADEDVPETKKSLQANLMTILNTNIFNGYKYYALARWFMTQNIVPELARKYIAMYETALGLIKSNRLHNNNKLTRPSRPYNMI